MELKVNIKLNENLYLRDPESSELGRRIVKNGIELIYTLGLESFTFKKLAEQINTTEASIYRYFESKQRLLQYIVAWYWVYLEYQVVFHINNLNDPEVKIKKVIDLLLGVSDQAIGSGDFNTKAIYEIVIQESSKAYLNKEVDEANSVKLFQPYKDLCARIAGLITDYNPDYKFPRSLSSTLIETAHFQDYFMQHLPRLTDFGQQKDRTALREFLESLVFSAIKK
jgi:AcrR family transcriptional regulator